MQRGGKREPGNIFLRMHPLQRILISVILAGIAGWLTRKGDFQAGLVLIFSWSAFAFSYLVTTWIVIFTRTPAMIRAHAKEEDGSRMIVFALVLLGSFGSLFTVLELIVSDQGNTSQTLTILSAVGGMLLSWAMVHTIFTIHYGYLYYNKPDAAEKKQAPALNFPEEDKPDYLDFAYFAFVIGMTFQVSDVEVQTKLVRRVVLLHGLLSFLLNTFVVALTINIIAGLKN
ncbi:DUF1345 domain-containing protein [Sediminibacterium ginsengisoli]|uniref:Uncharacterized membrane protein n=1 Tax=Sediminibacterium ginsengisoli TaxID=413434 RepID=A0A1T4PC05_9BACT|nr:DUF1345 domain-containing protein [Sediminibacterium ginsengisoli]SJZ88358.1 Uncharacterized membrane protein [Sediminibacterium ginsengisoli]